MPLVSTLCRADQVSFSPPLPTNHFLDAPVIMSVTESRSFAPGEQAVLSCQIQANPLEAGHVRWTRPGYDFTMRTTTTFENNTSFLYIENVQRSDIGNFTCIVDNQRGAAATQNVLLVVQSRCHTHRERERERVIPAQQS